MVADKEEEWSQQRTARDGSILFSGIELAGIPTLWVKCAD